MKKKIRNAVLLLKSHITPVLVTKNHIEYQKAYEIETYPWFSPMSISNSITEDIFYDLSKHKLDLSDKSILIADDSPINLAILSEIFTYYGARITLVTNGQEAFCSFFHSAENEFDLIIMDIDMPEMDGIAATKMIRHSSHTQSRTIPIIAVSGYSDWQDINMAKKSGMNSYLSKPYNITMITTLLTEILQKSPS